MDNAPLKNARRENNFLTRILRVCKLQFEPTAVIRAVLAGKHNYRTLPPLAKHRKGKKKTGPFPPLSPPPEEAAVIGID